MCLVVDEVTSFHRKLFEVEDYLMIRPMRNHAIKIPINSRILLSADGGTFNNEYMDKQIVNRVAVIDLRGEQTGDLGSLPVTKKYGRKKIQLVMTHYLYTQILNRLKEYDRLNHIDKADKADNIIQSIFDIYKQQKEDFFEIVQNSLYEILANPKDALDSYTYNILLDAMVTRQDGWIIKRPETVIPKILINYDESLEYELGYKKVKQIEAKIDGFITKPFKIDDPEGGMGATKTIRGLFIPKEKIIKKPDATMIKINAIKDVAMKAKTKITA
jgi:hypothetical protein